MESVGKHTLKITTYESYQIIFHKHILPTFSGKKLQDLTPLLLQKFYTKKAEEGLSNEYVRKIHCVLRSLFKYAIKWKYIFSNPCSLVEPPKLIAKKKKTWSISEANQFLKHTKNENLHIAYVLAIYTGMRMGEILGLRWQDCDLERGRISIVQTLTKTKNGLIFQEPKTKGSRRGIDVTQNVVHALKAQKLQQDEDKLNLGSGYQDNDLVVCTSLGTPMVPENLRRHYNRMIRESGVERIRFHDIRHTHATIMLQLGEHPKIVSERLGHSRTSVTLDIYSHVTPGLQAKAANNFSNALENKESITQ